MIVAKVVATPRRPERPVDPDDPWGGGERRTSGLVKPSSTMTLEIPTSRDDATMHGLGDDESGDSAFAIGLSSAVMQLVNVTAWGSILLSSMVCSIALLLYHQIQGYVSVSPVAPAG